MAFFIRKNERAPSGNWLEFFNLPIEESLEGIREAFGRKDYKLAQSGTLVRFNVGAIRREGKLHDCDLKVIHTPMFIDKSHSEIFGYSKNNDDTLHLRTSLAQLATLEYSYPAKGKGK